MIISKNKIIDLPKLINFHHREHESLSISIIQKVADKVDFKLKIQKASIQFLNPKPFAVIGLRKSRKTVFLEFFNENEITQDTIVKTMKWNNGFFINRVDIGSEADMNPDLIEFIEHSNDLINQGEQLSAP